MTNVQLNQKLRHNLYHLPGNQECLYYASGQTEFRYKNRSDFNKPGVL